MLVLPYRFFAFPHSQVHDWQLQIPAGVVADRFGGVHVLLAGLACWSTMTGLNPLAGYTTHPLQTLVVMRAALGLAQSVMMPSVSATAAR
jgi:MFS family permease